MEKHKTQVNTNVNDFTGDTTPYPEARLRPSSHADQSAAAVVEHYSLSVYNRREGLRNNYVLLII